MIIEETELFDKEVLIGGDLGYANKSRTKAITINDYGDGYKIRQYVSNGDMKWQRVENIPMQLPVICDLTKYLERQKEWSIKTFGNGKRTLGIIKHIEKELKEIEESPNDLTEWIDVVILALDGYWRHGGDPNEVMNILQAKQSKNFTRVYPFPKSEDEPSEHDRSI